MEPRDGEELLTVRIFEVLSQFCVRILPRYFALTNHVCESIAESGVPGTPQQMGLSSRRTWQA